MDPTRLKIQKAMTVALSEITPANGYVLDFTGAVFRGRTFYGEGDPLPMLSILQSPIPLEQLPPPDDSGLSSGGWELVVQGFFKDDEMNPTDPAEVGLADVKKRLAIESKKANYRGGPENGIFGLGNDVVKMQLGQGVVRPPDVEISEKAYFWLTVTLWISEDLSDPYGVNS